MRTRNAMRARTSIGTMDSMVFGTEPGETDYSLLWDETIVRWKAGVTPVLLVKEDQIKALAAKGELTIDPTSVVLNCPIVKVRSSSSIPTATTIAQPVAYGYYDGHIDTMLSTDVSDKAQAASGHICGSTKGSRARWSPPQVAMQAECSSGP